MRLASEGSSRRPRGLARAVCLRGLQLLLGLLLSQGAFAGHGQAPPSSRPQLAEVLTIGCGECEGPELLSAIGIALSDEGEVVTLDQFEPFVRVFGPDGAVTEAFGTRGEGPGELGMPGAIYVRAQGGYLVHDYMPRRFAVFSASGTYIGAIAHPPGVPTASAYDAAAEVLYVVTFRMPSRTPSVIAVSASTETARTVLEAEGVIGGPGQVGPGDLAIAVTPHGGFMVGNALTYEIGVYDSSGTLMRSLGRDIPLPARRSTAQPRPAALSSRARASAERGAKRHFGSHALQVDDEDRLWVLSNRGAVGESIFDVFSADGLYIESVTIDAAVLQGTRAFAVGPSLLAALVPDQAGNTLARVWAVTW